MNGIVQVITWITSNLTGILGVLAAIYGLLAAIVKLCPTLGEGWLLEIIKILGKVTNRQTQDSAIRADR